jgi:hypothetical protein
MPVFSRPARKKRKLRGRKFQALGRKKANGFEFKGKLKIKAEEAAEGGPRRPRIELLANTGVPMRVEGQKHPVIIDIKGAYFVKDKSPILIDHKIDKRLGFTASQEIIPSKNQIKAFGFATSKTKEARELVQDAVGGFPFEASVGARIEEGYLVEDGDTAMVNGKEWEGPIIVSEKTAIREISVTVFGADRNTQAKIAARSQNSNSKGLDAMDFKEFVASLGFDLKTLTAAQKKKMKAQFQRMQELEVDATESEEEEDEEDELPSRPTRNKKIKAKAKRKKVAAGHRDDEEDEEDEDEDIESSDSDYSNRIAQREENADEIRAHFEEYEEEVGDFEFKVDRNKKLNFRQLKAHAIRNNWRPKDFEVLALRAARPNPTPSRFKGVAMVDKDLNAKALECSILRSVGIPESKLNAKTQTKWGLEAMFDEEVLEASHLRQHKINGSIQQLLELQIRSTGNYYTGLDRHSGEFVKAAVHAWEEVRDDRNIRAESSGFSTLNVVNILENVMHKASLAGFESVETVWRQLCGRRPLNDFKIHALYQLNFDGHFKKVDTTGELKHVSLVDSKKTLSAETYGAMLAIDRKTIRNDDLGLIVQKARSLGMLGAQRIEESVFVLLLSNPGSFFSVGNGNLITGAPSALSLTSLETANLAFMNQTVNGKQISNGPSILLAGNGLAITAGNIFTETKLAATGDTNALVFTKNPFAGRFRPVISGYLSNTGITDQDKNAISGQSATQWYLLSDPDAPQGAAIVIGFLDGRETPYFDEAETAFNVPGGIQMRSYLDWGVAMHMHQMALKSAGA